MEPIGRLTALAASISGKMTASACGPLVVADEVCKLADDWESGGWRAESGGKTCSQWLMSVCNERERFFRDRKRAVDRIGEHARRTWHHEAAVWASSSFDDEALKFLDTAVRREQRAAGEVIFSRSQVARIARNLDLHPAVHREKTCRRCMEKDVIIRDLMRRFGVDERPGADAE